MAKSSSVWGIEIGQSALKALRCSLVNDEVVADAFDLIEYPKILSQPEADPEEMIAEALNQLIERNDGMNEKICMSVPGQSGLSKFFKPPPVEVKKIADLVRYEARQQIPFDLSEVVWDYQMMPGSMVEDGYALDCEVGLFAMKQQQAKRQMQPFNDANLEVDVVQLAPIALYNMVAYDRMNERLEGEVFNSDDPPQSSVVLSIGTDSSDLIVTNGFRIWQRSMPIGGNHFTRQLTKDLKMTFAQAEHIKRNAREAVDPKLIFQTMRPVFNDLVTEVQRSIGFFRSIDRKADIGELLVTGNTVKMPGLAAYLGKNLGFDVHVLDRFNRLGGEDVLSMPAFRDNATTFAVCYGLCLQGLGQSQMHASLVPQDIITERMIRAKKPWTVAGLACLMFGLSTNFYFTQHSWQTSHKDIWKSSNTAVANMAKYADEHTSQDADLEKTLTYLNAVGEEIAGDADKRVLWMELIRGVNQIIPRGNYPDGQLPSPKELPYEQQIDFHITSFETKYYDEASLTEWFEKRTKRFTDEDADWRKVMNVPLTEEEKAAGVTIEPPTGPAWVIELQGFHYFNDDSSAKIGLEGNNHTRRYLTTAFRDPSKLPDDVRNRVIRLPNPNDPNDIDEYTPAELGISYPLMLNVEDAYEVKIPNPDYEPPLTTGTGPGGFSGGPAAAPAEPDPDAEPQFFTPKRMDFVFQFLWKPTTYAERMEARRLKAEEEKALMEENGTTDPASEDSGTDPAATDDSVAANS
ncbi:type IV pilus assembly protein PilM [Rhodopirellula sp. MGV]|uniref:type IV pilus assembly protein PilM n=1 Tax=Rhodopirellula sp. MGV TaxID=2023130 RepID=UPI000B97559D|nr:type IV pilus assembly protein PilM [Rhodopirellula sp. MGV]OYP33138.1 pilus assembly protein PilM [Rhodopirellula sp. MGV]PNY35133.1 pilus assembly protein PilM [Rhodopirellula baltica]